MTTIVGIQGENYAVLATDSRISDVDESGGIYQVSTLSSRVSKITQNGKYLIGAAGDLRAINLISYIFSPPSPSPSLGNSALDRFMIQKFIPSLRECFESSGYSSSSKDSPNTAEHASTIIVAINAVIYIIDGDYSCMSDKIGIYAVGTGAPFALGALQAFTDGQAISLAQAKKISSKALSIAAKFDPYTGSPYHTFVQEA